MFVLDLFFSLLAFVDSLIVYMHIACDFYAMYTSVRHTLFIIITQFLSIMCNVGVLTDNLDKRVHVTGEMIYCIIFVTWKQNIAQT